MPLEIIRNDISKVKVDAIVNPTNKYLDGSGGTDRRIHEAAGPDLALECKALNGLEVGTESSLTFNTIKDILKIY